MYDFPLSGVHDSVNNMLILPSRKNRLEFFHFVCNYGLEIEKLTSMVQCIENVIENHKICYFSLKKSDSRLHLIDVSKIIESECLVARRLEQSEHIYIHTSSCHQIVLKSMYICNINQVNDITSSSLFCCCSILSNILKKANLPCPSMSVTVELSQFLCSSEHAIEAKFLEWYMKHQNDAALTKKIVLIGFCAVVEGVSSYYEECFSKDKNGLCVEWKMKMQSLIRQKEDEATCRINEITESSRSEVKRVTESMEQEKRHMTERMTRMQEGHATDIESMQQRLMLLQNNQNDLVKQEIQRVDDQHRHEIEILKADHERRLLVEKNGIIITANATISQLNSRVALSDARCREVEEKLHSHTQGIYAQTIEELKVRAEKSENELRQLKGTNVVKGIIGETVVSDYLRSRFTCHSVTDKSKGKGHSCDVWICKPDSGRFVAVEVKFKSQIQKDDVDKFESDSDNLCMHYSTCFLGCIFVSLRTKGIPRKGSICLEIRNNHPMLFIAFASESEFQGSNLFEYCMKMVWELGEYLLGVDRESDISGLLEKIDPLLKTIDSTQIRLGKVKGHATAILQESSHMEQEIRQTFNVISSVLATNGSYFKRQRRG